MTKRKTIWIVAMLILPVLIGAGWVTFVDKAWSSSATPVTTVEKDYTVKPRCVLESRFVTCPPNLRIIKPRQFRNNRLGRTNGFNPRVAFRNPGIAREQWVNKITWKLRHTRPAVVRPVQDKVNNWSLRVGRTARADQRPCNSNSRACAYEIYAWMKEEANCASSGLVHVDVKRNQCRSPFPSDGVTKREIKIFGSVVFCGGTVVIGVATSPLTVGATSFIAAWGISGCAFGAWSQMD